ncbi:MAG: hypothetical protein WBG41_07260 [Acidimicrobiales bacterium]
MTLASFYDAPGSVVASNVRDGNVNLRRTMTGHQEFRPLTAEEVRRAATHIGEMQKWAREAYLGTHHLEGVRPMWDRYFEAEHELHWLIPPTAEPEEP